MKFDNYFEIGTSHEVCQDYALTGAINDNIAYAIVADGCTMSHKECGQVDLGARILAHSAKDTLNRIFGDQAHIKTNDDDASALNRFFREKAIITTHMIERQIDLPPLFADCTLLAAVVDSRKRADIYMYGDGNVFVKLDTGNFVIVDITFLSSAPFYLSYHTDPPRKRAYIEEFGEAPILIDTYVYTEDGELETKNAQQTTAKEGNLYDKTTFTFDSVEFLSLMSDGVKSFLKQEESGFNPVDYLEVIRDFNNLKNKNGVFVQRRMKSVAKRHKKANITHYDDISVASVITE